MAQLTGYFLMHKTDANAAYKHAVEWLHGLNVTPDHDVLPVHDSDTANASVSVSVNAAPDAQARGPTTSSATSDSHM
jgi:hypothetical protein